MPTRWEGGVGEIRPELKLTYEDLQAFPDDGKRHEIIDGEHYVTPAPRTRHQAISMNLSFLLRTWLEAHPGGTVLAAPVDVVLSNIDVVEPDLVYVSRENLRRITEKNIQGPPDLAVEILSEGTRRTDELIKRKLYEKSGVPEYWILDPELEIVKVFRRAGEAFVRVAELSREAGDTLETPLLPGFAAPLAKLFE